MLDNYKKFMEEHLASCYNYLQFYGRIPLFRYDTFKKSFELFREINGKTIVELGTPRSFVHGGLKGCNSDDLIYWTPEKPENWDWGAGIFSRVAVEEFQGENVDIHTVDLIQAHINRSKIINSISTAVQYHVCDSVLFLKTFKSKYNKKIDLLYIDTGDMTPIEPTAQHQLEEAKIVIKEDLIVENGLILIDDVKNPAPIILSGEKSLHGKAKYSIPYFLENGYDIVMDEYQTLLKRVS